MPINYIYFWWTYLPDDLFLTASTNNRASCHNCASFDTIPISSFLLLIWFKTWSRQLIAGISLSDNTNGFNAI